MNAHAPVAAHDRLERVLAHTGHVLKELRHTGRAGALSGDLAVIWRRGTLARWSDPCCSSQRPRRQTRITLTNF
jgi:hypothetical protein